jgi:hypothetical protein
MIMKIKSSVLFGLIVLICSISGFSLLKRMTREIDEWRPSDLYSTTNVSRRSTYSVVSSGASASYSGAVPSSVSSGASSMFRHRAVSSYAPAYVASSSLANSQYPIGGAPSNSVASPMYATSSAEFRSFGGGGNVGAVSMSGGSIKSSSSSMANASGLSISMPSIPGLAYNNGSTNYMLSVPGDIAMASTQSYAGIGHTTGGGPRGMSSRRNALGFGDSWWVWFDKWLSQDSNGAAYGSDGSYTFDKYTLMQAYNDFINSGVWNTGMSGTPSFEEWLDWYLQSIADSENGYHIFNGHEYHWLPVGDVWPLFVMLFVYAVYVLLRRRKTITSQID